MRRGFLSVVYTEGDQSTYKRLVLEDMENNRAMEFCTGDPVVDFYDYYKYLYSGGAKSDGYYIINHSSLIDHFFMDGTEVVERYFYVDDDDMAVMVPNEEVIDMPMSKVDNLHRCVMYDWMVDFSDLNEYVKNKKT